MKYSTDAQVSERYAEVIVFLLFPCQVHLWACTNIIVSLFPESDKFAYHTNGQSTCCLTITLAIQQMQLYVFIRTCSTYSLISFAGNLGVVHMQSSP
jgi:hypothetical protein